ncbi:sugar porter family MFS transporter [Paraglaciecola aquimarina]|uniref:Sugar porter family MFS transporter n=2 Tax=Paraglaciecola algarum TaxID=3050085 RepID=A0ABS9DA84_9ALTE|nr:sugar porter family MFS transporter [Paraglaciecola sp. G1-23]MCF2949791.1 sugar porter family MFS transporter [Paraglaciecola sp. G1-23]
MMSIQISNSGVSSDKNRKNSKQIFLWSLTAGLAGFLFGFDTVVISGAEKTIQSLWGLSSSLHGLAISAALWGTVLGALIGGWPTDRYGRVKTLIAIGLLYFVSAVWSALATDPYSFMFARFIGGLGVGISTIVAPLYISEISPADKRGRLTGLYQFNIVLGILIAFISNALLGGIGENAWRWMLGVEAIPAIIYCLLCFSLPETPRWLIGKCKKVVEGKKVLALINAHMTATEIDDMSQSISAASSVTTAKTAFWSSRLKYPILLAFLIAFFNQLSGINAILYFSPRIFEMTGLGQEAALLQSAGIGLTNLIATFLGLWLIDRIGRRTLLYIGSFGYILALGACSWAFANEVYSIIPFCIFLFIAAHAIGQGAVVWVFIAEVFPTEHRTTGQSLGCSTHWIFAALLTFFFPMAVSAFEPSHVFGFFCFMMILQLIWVYLMVPETKGISLEDLQKKLGISKSYE